MGCSPQNTKIQDPHSTESKGQKREWEARGKETIGSCLLLSKGFFLLHPFMKPDLDDGAPVNADFVPDVVEILDQSL